MRQISPKVHHNRTEFWVSSHAFVLLKTLFSVRASLLKFSGDVGNDMELLHTKGQVSSSPHSEVRLELAEKCVELHRLTLIFKLDKNFCTALKIKWKFKCDLRVWKTAYNNKTHLRGTTFFVRPKFIVKINPMSEMKRNWLKVMRLPLAGSALWRRGKNCSFQEMLLEP